MNHECINLKERFGRRYKVEYEQSYFAEYGPGARVEDPVLMIVPCKYGQLYPAGGNLLAAVFDVADLPAVARVMRPRRRRQVSNAEKARLRAMGFRKGQQGRPDVQHSGRTGAPMPSGDSEHLLRQTALFDR